MEKLSIFLLIILGWTLLCEKAYSATTPDSYIVVGISGFGTRRPDQAWQPSGAHENLPEGANVLHTYRLVHFAKTKELKEVIQKFDCRQGRQQRKGLGLVLVINSWGASVAHQLANMYVEQCGRKVDYVALVDGVAKPIGAFAKAFPANRCFNYYQTKGLVRGKAQATCENRNLTDECEWRGLSAVDCHIMVEWEGTAHAKRLLESLME